jgi:hypothetical protein
LDREILSAKNERARRQELKKQLAVFLQEGQKIQNDLQFNNSTALHAGIEWQQRVADYLTKNLDESYVVRFRNPSHQVSSYPMGINRGMMSPSGRGDGANGDAQRLHFRVAGLSLVNPKLDP